MSLLTTASIWESSDEKPKGSNKTRRKPSQCEKNIAKTIEDNQLKSDKISQLLSNMNNVIPDNEGNYLESFTPPPIPKNEGVKEGYKTPFQKSDKNSDISTFSPMNSSLQEGFHSSAKQSSSNYHDIYKGDLTNLSPELNVTKQTIGHLMGTSTNDKLLDKLNYMIQLLEDQQHEQTQHVTEEFLLYTLLGVFIIYIVDSFTRCGKYVR
jgi:hypothetical protein